MAFKIVLYTLNLRLPTTILCQFDDDKTHAAMEIIANPKMFFGKNETDYSALRSEVSERQFTVDKWVLTRESYPYSKPEETTFTWKWTSQDWIVYDEGFEKQCLNF